VVASVVPIVDRPLFEGCEKYFGVQPVAFTAASQTIIPSAPTAGRRRRRLDRRAIAAREIVGAPAIAINFGTATTYGIIDADGAYAGVAIAPGLQFPRRAGRRRSCASRAACAGRRGRRDTVTSIQAGIVYGASVPPKRSWRASRGDRCHRSRDASADSLGLAGETPVIERVEPHLVLFGLRAHYNSLER